MQMCNVLSCPYIIKEDKMEWHEYPPIAFDTQYEYEMYPRYDYGGCGCERRSSYPLY